MTKIICKYRCQNCGYEFSKENPGQVICEKCGYYYIDWLNFKEVLKSIDPGRFKKCQN